MGLVFAKKYVPSLSHKKNCGTQYLYTAVFILIRRLFPFPDSPVRLPAALSDLTAPPGQLVLPDQSVRLADRLAQSVPEER